jgi:hypothetical protein
MFETNNTIFLINKTEGESNKYYYTKCKYLSNQTINNNNFNKHLKEAHMHANNKILNIKY